MSARTSSMPSFARHRLGGARVVAGRHDDLQTAGVQRLDRLGRRRLDRIGDGDDAGQPAVDGDEHRRLALGGAARRPSLASARGVDAQVRHHRLIAERDRLAVDRAAHALAGDRLEIAASASCSAALLRRPRRSPRPAGAPSPFPGSRPAPSSSVLVEALGGDHIGQLRPALGQRAGLVDDQRVDLGEAAPAPRRP